MKIEIKHRWTGDILFSVEADSWRFAVEAAVKAKADLSEANLSKADLSWANLSEADLSVIKADLWSILLFAVPEIPALKAALKAGKVDGSTYSGDCACLCGTIANTRKCEVNDMPNIQPDSSRPIERFFLAIRPGNTPENSQAAKIALDWIEQFETAVENIIHQPI